MKKYILLSLSTLLFCTACIDQIDLKTENEAPLVVVDAVFTDVNELQTVSLYLSQNVDIQTPGIITGAIVHIEDQLGQRITFIDQGDGRYTAEAKAIAGRTYQLIITLPDGRTITSNTQPVPNAFPIDDISIIDTAVMILDENGSRQRIKSIDFYAQASVPSVLENYYLRFSPKTVYQVTEEICDPLIPSKVCYFYNDTRPSDVNLLEVDLSNGPTAYNAFVYRRRISTDLGEAFALDLSLYAYNKNEYEYWKRVKSIFDQSGNITDAVPARLVGNMTADDDSEILGLFAVVGKSRAIKFMVSADFPSTALPYCGIPGLRPSPLPEGCCDCLELAGASTVKPDFWP